MNHAMDIVIVPDIHDIAVLVVVVGTVGDGKQPI